MVAAVGHGDVAAQGGDADLVVAEDGGRLGLAQDVDVAPAVLCLQKEDENYGEGGDEDHEKDDVVVVILGLEQAALVGYANLMRKSHESF